MVAKVESKSGSKNGWGFEYRLPSSKAVTSLCHPLDLETRKDGLRYSTVMFISSGFLKTLRAFSSLHLFCRMCNFSVEYGGRRPFLCGGCVGPMLIFTSNSLALPLSILNWGLNRNHDPWGLCKITVEHQVWVYGQDWHLQYPSGGQCCVVKLQKLARNWTLCHWCCLIRVL